MWEGFDPYSNPLLPILEASVPGAWQVVTDKSREVDLEIGSVYPRRVEVFGSLVKATIFRRGPSGPADVREAYLPPGKAPNARAGIWYTPENRRPPDSGWDGYLSFDPDTWPRNAHLPFWQLNSDLFGGRGSGLLGEPLIIDRLLESRNAVTSRRKKFCCAIIRNPDPVRLNAIEMLNQLSQVDILGPYARRPLPNKAEVPREYRFALVFENDLYPGYVTEKAFDAWHCGAVPLYWGIDAQGYLNSEAMLNMANMAGPDELVAFVARLESDSELLDYVASQPILSVRPSSNAVVQMIRRVMGRSATTGL